MDQYIREQLMELSEEKYRDFSDALVPGETRMLGVRLPKLRKLAKEIAKGDFERQLKSESQYFEEKMLKGMIIGYATEKDKTADRGFCYLKDFIEEIDNWSVCDSFCNTFKVVRNDPENAWENIQKYLDSKDQFQVRTGLILILNHLIKMDKSKKRTSRLRTVKIEDLSTKREKGLFETRIIERLNRPFEEGYYARMAAAWTVAEMFVTYPESTYHLLLDHHMDQDTFHKAVQKICESLIPEKQVKDLIKKLK